MFLALTLVCPVVPALGGATPPYAINYQGFLADNNGTPVADGDYEITFRLYDALTGGTALWRETWNGANLVAVENGRFNAALGRISPFADANLDFNFSTPYYLEIQVGSDTPFSPRLALAAVAEVGSFLMTVDGDDVGAGVTTTDLIVLGNECIGSDCVNGETFDFDTLMLKENNLRIYFNDTSNSASFPSNDWRLTANDSSNGGRNYFSIDDVTSGITGLVVEAGGNVGIGTPNIPRGKLEVMTYATATGTLSTASVSGTGTVTTSTVNTSVVGAGTAFTTELVVGGVISAGG